MRRKESEHPTLVRLLNNVVYEIPVTQTGTYNRQDPTHYEKGQKEFSYDGKDFMVTFHDCTWGIEIEIYKVTHYENSKTIWYKWLIAGFYVSRDSRYNSKTDRWEGYDKIIYRQKGSKGALKLLALVFPQCLQSTYRNPFQIEWDEAEKAHWLEKEDPNEWVDPAGGVHYGDYDEPWKMYE